eukprot:5138080-Prorocentrum_lima.AAC.1
MSLAQVRQQQTLGVISSTPVCHQQFAYMPPVGWAAQVLHYDIWRWHEGRGGPPRTPSACPRPECA